MNCLSLTILVRIHDKICLVFYPSRKDFFDNPGLQSGSQKRRLTFSSPVVKGWLSEKRKGGTRFNWRLTSLVID